MLKDEPLSQLPPRVCGGVEQPTTCPASMPSSMFSSGLASVAAGLLLPWSGVVEGHVHRIKMIKRQMSGRAGFGVLRRRVLPA